MRASGNGDVDYTGGDLIPVHNFSATISIRAARSLASLVSPLLFTLLPGPTFSLTGTTSLHRPAGDKTSAEGVTLAECHRAEVRAVIATNIIFPLYRT